MAAVRPGCGPASGPASSEGPERGALGPRSQRRAGGAQGATVGTEMWILSFKPWSRDLGLSAFPLCRERARLAFVSNSKGRMEGVTGFHFSRVACHFKLLDVVGVYLSTHLFSRSLVSRAKDLEGTNILGP